MELKLTDRVALITGGSRGIGYEIARTLGSAGAKIVICARHRQELAVATRRLHAEGIEAVAVAVDLEKAGAAERVLKVLLKTWNRLDILVNNVGGLPETGAFEQLSDKAWMRSFQLNLMPTVRFCRAALPLLRRSTAPRVINLSSMVAAQPGAFNPHYSACKAAILNLTKHLSGILAKDGILVNSISPGIIHTEGWDEYIAAKAERTGLSLAKCRAKENRRAVKNVPLRRLGVSREVASLVTFLASDEAAFITGANHRVDGGRVQAAT